MCLHYKCGPNDAVIHGCPVNSKRQFVHGQCATLGHGLILCTLSTSRPADRVNIIAHYLAPAKMDLDTKVATWLQIIMLATIACSVWDGHLEILK